ncbi:NAD(P)-binding protein [Hypoxylon sp. NC1633]|nr:NAD(P)-binding protein [Hypoxylon sp. NC1633]
MSSFMKVAIAGVSGEGNLGAAVLGQLLKAGFQVTALTRQGSSRTFPSGVTIKPVDYDSLDSLTEALQGQDAVVSTIGGTGLLKQLPLLDAAVKAGVKRFIPSEFGSDTFHEKTSRLPGYHEKVVVREAINKAVAESNLTWSAVLCGPFLDWCIALNFLANAKERTIDLPDGGNSKYSVSTLETVGKAVVGVLKNPEQTENRVLYVQNAAITQKELLAMLKKAVGADGWKETVTSVEDQVQKGYEEAKKDKPDFLTLLLSAVLPAIFGEGYGGHFKKLDNDLLGIKQFSDAEIEAVVFKNVPK